MTSSSFLRWGLALLTAATVGCGRDSLVFSDSLEEWCDGAPCGWRLDAGSVTPTSDGARLGGGVAAALARTQPVDLGFAPDDPFPGFLVVLSTGNTLLELRWSDGTSEQLLLNFTEPTYLYLQLAPPRTADRFAVALSTRAGESSLLNLVGVTRCAPSAANRHVGINSALEGDRVLFWYYVEERYYTDFGSECPSGGGGGGDESGAVGGGE
jgi:hypothetical protein